MHLLGANGGRLGVAPAVGAMRFGQGFFGRMGANISDPSQHWSSRRNIVGGGMKAIGGALGLAGGAFAIGAGMAWQRRQQLAQVRRKFGLARLYGMDRKLSLRGGVSMGMMPEQYASTMQSFAQARGFEAGPRAGLGLGPTRLMASGAGIGALAQFAGLSGPGGGATGGRNRLGQPAVDALRQAVTQGVRGAGLDRWLQAIAGYTGQVAAQGGRVNLGSVNRLTGRMQATRGLRGLGTMQPQLMARGMSAVQGARQQVLGGLGGINQALAIQQASQLAGAMPGGATPQNLARAFDQMMQDPNQAFGAFQGQLGELGFIGMGLSADVSRGMANLSDRQAVTGKLPRLKGIRGARMFAGAEAEMLGAADEHRIKLKELIEAQTAIQKKTMELGTKAVNAAVDTATYAKQISETFARWALGR
jgi:hypothetical protein